MVEKAIFDILRSDPAIVAIVGDRIYLDFTRSSTMPYIVYGRAGTERITHLGGTAGLVMARIEVTCIGTAYAVLVTLATEIREALAAYQGTRKGVRIQNATIEDEWSTAEQAVAGGDFEVYRRTMDFRFTYEEEPIALHA